MIGIKGWGMVIPQNRVDTKEIAKAWGIRSAVRELAVEGYDEDVVTLGIEAGKNCLASVEVAEIKQLVLATTSPYELKPSSTIIADDLDLVEVACLDIANTTSSLTALELALKSNQTTLFIAADGLVVV